MSIFVESHTQNWTRTLTVNVFFALGVLLCTPQLVSAEVVLFDSGVDPPDASYTSDTSSSINQFIADDFSLEFDSLVTRIQWTGAYTTGLPDDAFDIWIMRDIDPDADRYLLRRFSRFEPTQVNRQATGRSVGGLSVYEYDADVSSAGVTLNADERLYISIFNRTDNQWQWGTDTNFGEMYYANDNTGGVITPFQSTMDFTISGQQAVPEPSTYLFLLVLGIVVFTPRLIRRAVRSES